MTKFINELITKTKEKPSDSTIQNSTRTAQIYFTHKLVNVMNSVWYINKYDLPFCFLKDKILDINLISRGKTYFISDIEWFCHAINNLFNIETRIHRKAEQIKHTIGKNIHMISKRDFKNLKINADEVFTSI